MTLLTLGRFHPDSPSRSLLDSARRLPALIFRAVAVVLLTAVLLAALYEVVPAYVSSQAEAVASSSARQGVPASWLAAVFYNEILGTEDSVLQQILPGDAGPAPAVRQVFLGLHFCTLKQAQWQIKTVMALLGSDPTVGPAGIRVSVGREIRHEVGISVGSYAPTGWLERPSMILDLTNPATSLEYLAANLRRGQDRLAWSQRGDWAASARWHNTGVVYDSDIVRPADWDKGTKYVARVEEFLPEITPLVQNELKSDSDATARPPRGMGRQAAAARRPATPAVP